MTEQEIKDIVTRQRKYFYTGATLPVSTRLAALQKLYNAISGKKILGKADLKVICAKPAWCWKRSAIC